LGIQPGTHQESYRKIHATLVLAMSADGKIADAGRSPARFGSPQDKAHLEHQITQADAVIFGAGTLRSYGTAMQVCSLENQELRVALGKPPQPIQIVVSRRGEFDPTLRFFSQSVPRWLVIPRPAIADTGDFSLFPQFDKLFDKVIVAEQSQEILWQQIFEKLVNLGIKKLAVLGGGELAAPLIAQNLIDEFWLTLCPVIFGGKVSPTPMDGLGLTSKQELELLETKVVGSEIFLHYRFLRSIIVNG
jgi:5-amino-6-(5-phosphoribosylamino)uracil reductase